MTLKNHSTELRQYLQQLGYNKSSVKMLPNCVQSFLDYHNNIAVETITQTQIESFHNHLQIRPNKKSEGGLSESYIHHHIYALKVFFNWLEQTGQIRFNPISTMKFKQPKANTRQPLSTEEIKELFASCTTKQETAMLHLFYSCGLRRNEAVALNIQDIHFKNKMLYVRNGKGAKRRAVPITTKVSRELENYYLQERTQLQTEHDYEAFILNTHGKRMQGETYRKALKQIIANTANPVTGCSLHHLRHSIATHLLESGLNIESVRDFLGHSHLESTQIYAKVNKYQLRKL